MQNPGIRELVTYTANCVPYTERVDNVLTIKTCPRPRDLMDSVIDYSYTGSLALIGGGGLGLTSDYLTSNTREGSTHWPTISLVAGVLWGGATRVVVTLNDYRHTQNFYRLYDQAQAQMRTEQNPVL